MAEEDICRSLLKVIDPYEGTAFVAAPGIAVSCKHVVLRDGADPNQASPVILEYHETLVHLDQVRRAFGEGVFELSCAPLLYKGADAAQTRVFARFPGPQTEEGGRSSGT